MQRKKYLRRRRKIRILSILIMLCAAAIAFIFISFALKKSEKVSFAAYSLSESGNKMSEFNLQRSSAFADNLVVSDSSVSSDTIALDSSDEKAAVFNLDTRQVLYANKIYDRIYPASITKIMTAYIALKYGNMSDKVVMDQSDFELEDGAQTSGLSAGDTVTMDELFHILLIYSGNDAAMAIARHIGGDVTKFVQMMNTEAQSLGMTGTNFVNPSGLHDDNHYTTAYDVYLMLNAAYQYPEFSEVSRLGQYEVNAANSDGTEYSFVIYSTDEYLTSQISLPANISVMASKTGTTDEAGACLSLIVQDAYGVPYAAVVMNAYTHESLYNDMTKILNYINSSGS